MESTTPVLGLSNKKMTNKAYHDSLFIASHKPEEYAYPEEIANGVKCPADELIWKFA
ncbi:hypothetical protein M8C21_012724, partial [Ambrosia artemisiifolia]